MSVPVATFTSSSLKQKFLKATGQKALDACLQCEFFCFAFFFHSYKIGLSLEERKGNQDLRECFILGLQAIEVTERKKLFFFFSNSWERSMKNSVILSWDQIWNMLIYHLWTIHHPTGLDPWNLLNNRVRESCGKTQLRKNFALD